ncbi:MAG TPA: (d)CMP kinase [Pseudonocardiaceae bacterium]|nr:(d)CMP kinase [Pseudonocardiaceae bacterium]
MGLHGRLRGVVAVDGPAGSGKSTVARQLAASWGARYLDTGAMYRAAALGVLRAGINPAEPAAVYEAVERRRIEVGTEPHAARVSLDGEDVSAEIRSPAVTTAVSPVSAVPRVRVLLVAQQRQIITDALATVGGIVVEGRDIGTVVAPEAPLKVFLTASAAQRAARRAAQDGHDDLAGVQAAIERRDRFDAGREHSPMCSADDAIELDTTALDLEAVLARVRDLARTRDLVVPAGRDQA